MARLLQLASQVVEVIDLAVIDQGHTGTLMSHGLFTGLKIDDGKTPMSEADGVAAIAGRKFRETLSVRPAMADAFRHLAQLALRIGERT